MKKTANQLHEELTKKLITENYVDLKPITKIESLSSTYVLPDDITVNNITVNQDIKLVSESAVSGFIHSFNAVSNSSYVGSGNNSVILG